MEDYGKILKRFLDEKFIVELFFTDNLSKTDSYLNFMKSKYRDGYTQVIINSDLMLKISEKMLVDNWIFKKLEVDDPSIDEGTKNEIQNLLESIRKSPLKFNELKDYLDWALDEGSIFIDKIVMAKKDASVENGVSVFELTSSGIQRGNNKQHVFDSYVKISIEEFLNGR